jgi:hypothetical protein
VKLGSSRIPECQDLTAEADRLLKLHLSEVRDYTLGFHERVKEEGLITIDGPGWAVRPVFLPAGRLEFVGSAFHSAMDALRREIHSLADDPDALGDRFPFCRGIADAVAIRSGCESPHFLSYFRPDGFLFEDRYVLSEINFGNGIWVSAAYTELTSEYWSRHPVLLRMGLDLDRHNPRPFQEYIATVRRAARQVERPRIALLAHSSELTELRGFPERVFRQIEFGMKRFEDKGMSLRIVDENGLALDRSGNPVFADDGLAVDLVMLITVNTSFLDDLPLMQEGGKLRPFGQASIGGTPVLKPLAGLLMDKGALPRLCELGARQAMADGFAFDVAHTEFPCENLPGYYENDREGWVLKKAWDGKDTHPGIGRSDSEWIRIVSRASRDHSYVAQRYVSMPKGRLPVLIDGQHLEWVESRIELSSFMFGGRSVASGVRHAPDAEGHVMTDFPEGYGYTTALAI